jgi:hypothetical protein
VRSCGGGDIVIPVGGRLGTRTFFGALEPQHANIEQTMLLQRFAETGRRGAEVFTNHDRLVAL